MDRRAFLQIPAVALAADAPATPLYRVVTRHQPAKVPGMPGPYPGQVVSVHSPACIDPADDKVDTAAVREMMARGMRELTGARTTVDAWRRFFSPEDFVGIKVNCSGAPRVMSTPEIVAEIVTNLNAVGIKPEQIWIYERFDDQLQSVHYDRYVPKGVSIVAIEVPRRSIRGYDPNTYVEVDFFSEDDTRSNLIRLVSERFTKIINVPNMKDHSASGVTGCLKNIAYGNFSNVARSHRGVKTNTKTFIGTLASVEPLRSKTVLQVMDGLRGVWHAGPFVRDRRYVFHPKQMLFGTDPVAMDVVLREVIEAKRKAEEASSVWDRSAESLQRSARFNQDPTANLYEREPGHIEYAAGLGLGIADKSKIRHRRFDV